MRCVVHADHSPFHGDASYAPVSRWLSNEQAAADSANFIANVSFPGIDADLTAPGTPWIYYGVSHLPSRIFSHA